MAFFSMENRPLKKLKLGPPDVYPQDPKQKEDELTPINVKQGFSHTPNLQAEEYGTAKNLNFPVSKVQTFLTTILAKKQEINTLPDTGRKRQVINPKENFHNVTPKSKAFIESWFKDLAGSKPLIILGKKVPVFNKKEEIFVQLSEYQVPLPRALWLIKMTSAYFMTVSEAKMKKRQVPDSSQEWTVTLTRFLKEQLLKLQEFYNKHNSSMNTLMSGACNGTAYHNGNPMMSDEQKLALRQFNYCKQLSKIMMEEGLIESHDFLVWILDILDRCKTSDDGLLKLVLPVALQFIDEFTQCEMLSRRLAAQVAKKLSPLLVSDHPSEKNNLSSLNCQHHRGLVVQLSAIMQALVLHCPTALVWSHPGEGKVSSHLIGSPLDHLAIAPSALPMAPRFSNDHLRELLRESEAIIRRRSKAAEARWSLDQLCSQPLSSPTQQIHFTGTNRILQALDSLDRHSFDRVDQLNNIDHLYAKIFPSLTFCKTSVDGKNIELVATFVKQDEPFVLLLCNWAVNDHRYGEHRALATALLLEKRQLDVHSLIEAASGADEAVADESSQASLSNPAYQGLLMRFLDSEAPTSNDPNTTLSGNRASFASLVHLFYELIKHDVFSHDMYMRSLISRGDLQAMSNGFASSPISSSSQPNLTTPGTGVTSFQCLNDLRSEVDDSKIDDDLGKLLQHIKEDQQIVTDNPDSPKDDSTVQLDVNRTDKDSKRQSRHLAYTTHFPLPQDDHLVHDCNQRHILLYGVGKAREEARHVVKRVSKEVCRLFHKKLAIDIQAEGTGLAVSCLGSTFFNCGKSRKHSSRLEYNFEQSMQRFLALSYFDRHTVASQAAAVCVEMINSFATGGSTYLPILEHVSFLFDLFEVSLCISGLVELCLQILKDLPEVEIVLSQKNAQFTHGYTTSMGLYIVGVFRRFHSCLLLSTENTSTAFETLCKLVKHVSNPADCSSAERCILAYLYDLYSCCFFLKNRGNLESSSSSSNSRDSGSNRGTNVSGGSEAFAFSNAYPKIKQTIIAPVQPSLTTHPQNREYLQDYIANPRRKPESQVLRQLSDSPQSRYAFVYNVVIAVGNEADNDRVNDLALLCAELTASCSSLSSEWLGVLSTLCCAGRTYIDVLTHVDVQDVRIHRNLAIFFSILLARHCFGLHDFLLYVGLPALVTIWNEGVHSDTDSKTEAGARLTCHLVLRLFRTFDSPNPTLYGSFHSVAASPHSSLQPLQSSQVGVKLACDRHLLASLHNYIAVGPVLAVLKAILVLADRLPSDAKGNGSKAGGNTNGNNKLSGTNLAANELSMSHILGTSWSGDIDMDTASSSFSVSRSFGIAENVSLSSYARYVLKKICSQAWVHHRCLQNPDELLKSDVLLDSCLSFRQAQRLLEMISRPDSKPAVDENDSCSLDYRQVVNRVLTNLDQWRLRVAWLDLQLLSQQLIAPNNNVASNPTEINLFLDAVARAVIDVFDLMPPNNREDADQSSSAMNKKRMETPTTGLVSALEGVQGHSFNNSSISLIGPLVSKLPSAVQARVIRTACQVLETCNWTPPSKVKDKDRASTGSNSTNRLRSLLSYEPFLSLIMSCLRGQEDQRESFLTSLHQQLSQFVFLPKEDRFYQTEDCKNRLSMLEALQLRISLVGGLFDAILRNSTATIDWAVLLTQLVTSGTIDQSNNSELFTTVQDMLATLLHSLLVADSQSDRSEDSRKYYPTLIKKLKKELAERKNSPSTQLIKQLLPLPKIANEYVTCESYGTQTDNKGNKISGFDSSDKKQGYRLHEKQRVSPWEVLEGHKTAAPLSWAWFGAVRVERKPLRHQEVQRLLRHHTHSLHKPSSYFLEHPSFPPEEIETPVEKTVLKEEATFKIDTPASDQSPRGASKRGQKTNQRRPRARRGAAGNVPTPTQVSGGYQSTNTGMYVTNQPTSQWVGYNPPPTVTTQPAAAPSSAPFFQQQTGQGPKFPSERPGTTRQALSNMLRQRHPSAQFVPGSVNSSSMGGMPSNSAQSGVMPGPRPNMNSTMPGQPPFSAMQMTDKQRQQQFMRQQVRPQQPNNTMFGQGNPPQQQLQGPGATQPSQQIPINQGNFSNMQGSVSSNFGMFPNGAQSNMQLVNPQQVQNPPSQQGMGGQPFSQGNNFSMPQPQSSVNIMPINSQVQGRGLGNTVQRPPFIQNNMSMNSGQGGQFARGPGPNQQPGVRLQQQMPPMQQQQQQHMQHMNHSLGQHYHQQF